jgi:hypothetical protein
MSTGEHRNDVTDTRSWLAAKVRSGALLEYPTYFAPGMKFGQRPEKYARRLLARLGPPSPAHRVNSLDLADAERFRTWILSQPRPERGGHGAASDSIPSSYRAVRGRAQVGHALGEISKRVPAGRFPGSAADVVTLAQQRFVREATVTARGNSRPARGPTVSDAFAFVVVFIVLPSVLCWTFQLAMEGRLVEVCVTNFVAAIVLAFVMSALIQVMTRISGRGSRGSSRQARVLGQGSWSAVRAAEPQLGRSHVGRVVGTLAFGIPPIMVPWSFVVLAYSIVFMVCQTFVPMSFFAWYLLCLASFLFLIVTSMSYFVLLLVDGRTDAPLKPRAAIKARGVFDVALDG